MFRTVRTFRNIKEIADQIYKVDKILQDAAEAHDREKDPNKRIEFGIQMHRAIESIDGLVKNVKHDLIKQVTKDIISVENTVPVELSKTPAKEKAKKIEMKESLIERGKQILSSIRAEKSFFSTKMRHARFLGRFADKALNVVERGWDKVKGITIPVKKEKEQSQVPQQGRMQEQMAH